MWWLRRWAAFSLLMAVLTALPRPAAARHHASHNGAIVIKTNVAGAVVHVDGAQVGTTPMAHPFTVRAGTHVVEVSKDGVGKVSQKVTVAAGATVSVQAKLEDAAPVDLALEPLPPQPVEAVVLLPPTAAVAPPPAAQDPNAPMALPPQAVSPDAAPLEAQTTVSAPAWYDHWWVWAAAGVVVAGAGVATYALVKTHPQPDVTIQLNPAPRAGVHF